jgi:hypothetical protein
MFPSCSAFTKSCKVTMSELHINTIKKETVIVFKIFSSRFAQNTSNKIHRVIIYVTSRCKTCP